MNIRAKIFGDSAGERTELIKAKTPKAAKAGLGSLAVSRAEGRRSNSRADDRHRLVDQRVEAVHKGRSYDLELVNLSGGGAMVAGAFPAKLWDRVDLRLGEDDVIECAVCWVRGDRRGLEFAPETRLDCSVDERGAILRQVIVRSFPEVEAAPASEPQPSAEPAGPHPRSARRHPLIWSGILHYDFASTPVRIRNISTRGAMIESARAIAVGAQPLLELSDDVQLAATVTWAIGDTAGLRFDRDFDLSQLARSRPEVAPPKWLRPDYLAPSATDPHWDEEWKHLSLPELREELEGFWKH